MNKIYITLTLLNFCFNVLYSQNDTIFLEKNNIKLKNEIFNKLNYKGQKTGEWIQYGITEDNNLNIIEWDGESSSGTDIIRYKYRPLEIAEYCGMEKVISEKVDSTSNYYESTIDIISNKIPKERYYIKAFGKYNQGVKEGKWTYYQENGILKSIIYYEHGLPVRNFKIYAKDKSLMMEFKRINEFEWEVYKYAKDSIIDRKLMNVQDFKLVYK